MNYSGWKCSFCNRSRPEVKALVQGIGTSICDECIEKCRMILSEEGCGEFVIEIAGLRERTRDRPNDPVALFELAWLLGNSEQSLVCLERLIAMEVKDFTWDEDTKKRLYFIHEENDWNWRSLQGMAHACIANLLSDYGLRGSVDQNIGQIAYHYQKAMELRPHAADRYHIHLGAAYMEAKEWKQAVEELELVNDSHISAYSMLAEAHDKLGNVEESIHCARALLARNCEAEYTRRLLVRQLRQVGKNDEAECVEKEMTPERQQRAFTRWMIETGRAIKELPDEPYEVLTRLLGYIFRCAKSGRSISETNRKLTLQDVATELGISIEAATALKFEALKFIEEKGIDTTKLRVYMGDLAK